VLAAKLDACSASDTAAAAAMPRLAAELTASIEPLKSVSGEPNPLDLIRARAELKMRPTRA
jgi:hypothetical protein